MGHYDDPQLTPRPPGRSRWLTAGAVAAALVIGLAVGFVTGGGTSSDSTVADVETSPEPAPAPTTLPTPPAVQVCAGAGTAGAAVLAELDAAVRAAGVLDFGAVRESLDRLQPLQRELQAAVTACADAPS